MEDERDIDNGDEVICTNYDEYLRHFIRQSIISAKKGAVKQLFISSIAPYNFNRIKKRKLL